MKQSLVISRKSLVISRRKIFFIFIFLLLTSHFSLPTSYADEISARAAVVIDSESEKILYAKNPGLKLPPASTTKLVTAMVALDRLNPDTIVTISEHAANTLTVSPHLKTGEKFSVRDLLYLSLMRSVNSAAVAIAEAVASSEDAFVVIMNDRVAQLGAENTRFANSSGLPGSDQYITAFDLAMVMKESMKYPLIREIVNTRAKEIYSESGRHIFIKNTNQLLWTDDDNLGGKTGYTRAARHCFVSAAKRGQNTLIAAVLGEPERDNLWENSTLLLSKGYDVLNQKSEPMIYFSSVEKRPVVAASYKPDKKYKTAKHKNSKKAYISKKQKNKTDKIEKKTTKKNTKAKIAKKKVKESSKNLSAYRQKSANKF